MDYNKLLYKRGFIITDKEIELPNTVPAHWIKTSVFNYNVAYDPDVKFASANKGNMHLLMIGYCMDVVGGHMDLVLITKKLVEKLETSKDSFYDYIDGLNGRYILLYCDGGGVFIQNDATAARSVFYSENKAVVASHYNLVNEVVGARECEFYGKIYKKWLSEAAKKHIKIPWSLPGNLSPYKGIKILVANHEIEIYTKKIKRIYPRKPMQEVDVFSAINEISETIKKEVEILSKNYEIAQSLTAGYDSRITLSAVKNVAKKVSFFTYRDTVLENNYESLDRENNYIFAKYLCSREGLKHKEITLNRKVDPQINTIITHNHYHGHIKELAEKYMTIFSNNRIHLRANLIEIARSNHVERVNRQNFDLLAKTLAKAERYSPRDENFELVVEIFRKYIDEMEYDKLFNYSQSEINYWETRYTQWLGGAVLTGSDLASETFMLFNNRKLLDLGLSLPYLYKKRNIVYDGVIKNLWPELLNYGLPNRDQPLYEYVDKSFSGSGEVFDYKQGYNENNVRPNGSDCFWGRGFTVKSGNINDSNRSVSANYEPRIKGMSFGFASNKVIKGDYCQIEFSHSMDKDYSYYYQFNIQSTWMSELKSRIDYEILINDKVIYSINTNHMTTINQINYFFRASESGSNKIVLRLIAKTDCEYGYYNGVLNIHGISLKRDFSGKNFSYQPKIDSTFDRILAARVIAEAESDLPKED